MASSLALQQAVNAISERFASHFTPISYVSDESKRVARSHDDAPNARVAMLRTVGREAEFPVVTPAGEMADVRQLWPVLLEADDMDVQYGLRERPASFVVGRGESAADSGEMIVGLSGPDCNYSLEVGVGTVEITTRPCANLFEIERIMERAVRRVVHAATRRGWLVLGYGVQPRTPPTLRRMSPKRRYFSLYRAMGEAWLWYTVTASDQLHVSVGRDEMVQMLNLGNLMAPVLIALCANSPVYGGRRSEFCSAREGRMAQILTLEQRHGMPRRPFADMADYVQRIGEATFLIQKYDDDVIPGSQPFTQYLQEQMAQFGGAPHPMEVEQLFDAFLFHEHYVWNSARLRSAYSTIELRPACQQPWAEQMAAAALMLGTIEAGEEIWQLVGAELGDQFWEEMRDYHERAVHAGLAAFAPTPTLLEEIVLLAERGLQRRGLGEERLLRPIWTRLNRRLNPAQRMRQIFAVDGLGGLLRTSRIR